MLKPIGTQFAAVLEKAKPQKVARVVYNACMCSDDGRAITWEYLLFLNDHGGEGNWHGGPAFPNHCSRYDTEEAALREAEKLGYVAGY